MYRECVVYATRDTPSHPHYTKVKKPSEDTGVDCCNGSFQQKGQIQTKKKLKKSLIFLFLIGKEKFELSNGKKLSTLKSNYLLAKGRHTYKIFFAASLLGMRKLC